MSHKKGQEQTLDAKKAEYNRPYLGDELIENEEFAAIFRQRAYAMRHDARELRAQGITLGPFLEIGAGNVQRSAMLVNEFGVDGVATEISFKSLKNAQHVYTLLDFESGPLLICCDAHHIPFLPNTFAFVFAYQTLHHFDDLRPIIAECHRVLARHGHFFFDEEPVDSWVRRMARGNRMLSHPPTRAQALAMKIGVEKLFWDDGEHERSQGITEARFDIDEWREFLQPFKVESVVVNRKLKLRSDLYKPALTAFLSSLTGGNIRGLCRKDNGRPVTQPFRERLMCVDCQSDGLMMQETHIVCPNCDRHYPIEDGIVSMLPLEVAQYVAAPIN